LYEARPFALSPPAGFLPSLRCHAGVLATASPHVVNQVHGRLAFFADAFAAAFFAGDSFLDFLLGFFVSHTGFFMVWT
jgi:hypothetical protein